MQSQELIINIETHVAKTWVKITINVQRSIKDIQQKPSCNQLTINML